MRPLVKRLLLSVAGVQAAGFQVWGLVMAGISSVGFIVSALTFVGVIRDPGASVEPSQSDFLHAVIAFGGATLVGLLMFAIGRRLERYTDESGQRGSRD
jgi:hypothetical protein